MPSPEQKAEARKLIQHALVFLNSMEEAAEEDRYSQIPSLLIRLDGAMYDLRQTLNIMDPARATIQDEYEEDP